MKKSIILLFLAILTVLSCIVLFFMTDVNQAEKASQITETASAAIEPQSVNIVALGDSLTEGVGDITDKGGYLPYLQTYLENEKSIKEVRFDNFGVKGYRSEQLAEKVQTEEIIAAVKEADIVIMTIGGNDMMKVVRENITNLAKKDFQQQRELFEDNLLTVLDTIKNENDHTHIVLVGLYNPFHKWFPEIEEMNEVVSEWNVSSQDILARYPNTHFVDILTLFENEEEELLYTDYFHPNNRGYELIAGKVYKKLEEDAIEQVVEQKWLVQKQEEL